MVTDRLIWSFKYVLEYHSKTVSHDIAIAAQKCKTCN
jgi:hypothetical protein